MCTALHTERGAEEPGRAAGGIGHPELLIGMRGPLLAFSHFALDSSWAEPLKPQAMFLSLPLLSARSQPRQLGASWAPKDRALRVAGARAAQTAMLITPHLFPRVRPPPLEILISLFVQPFTDKQPWLLPARLQVTDPGPGAQALTREGKDSKEQPVGK